MKSQYRASLKSLDTEEHIDLAFYRPIGYGLAIVARRLGVTPNALTTIAIVLGVFAGILFYPSFLTINVCGMALLVLANTFDSADGQLARLTGCYSRWGRILDGLCGDFWFVTIYLAICLRQVHTSEWFGHHHWVIWVLAILAGVSHAKQAAMADYYRQFHLYFLKGNGGSELEHAYQLKRRLAAMSWRHEFLSKLTLLLYVRYTVNQESWTPAMQTLRRQLHTRWRGQMPPAGFRAKFRRLSLPLMKYTNILSFNWRVITLFVTLFVGQPWLYFVAEITIFNAILVYMRYRHEQLCSRMRRYNEVGR